MDTLSTSQITWSVAAELARRAQVDTRTIMRLARGEPVRGRAGYRAAEALRAAGYDVPLPDGASSSRGGRRPRGCTRSPTRSSSAVPPLHT